MKNIFKIWTVLILLTSDICVSGCGEGIDKSQYIWIDSDNKVYIDKKFVYHLQFPDSVLFNLNFFQIGDGCIFFGTCTAKTIDGGSLAESYEFYLFDQKKANLTKILVLSNRSLPSNRDDATKFEDDYRKPSLIVRTNDAKWFVKKKYYNLICEGLCLLASHAQNVNIPLAVFDANLGTYIYYYPESNIVMEGNMINDKEIFRTDGELISGLKFSNNGRYIVSCSMDLFKSEFQTSDSQKNTIQVFNNKYEELYSFSFSQCIDARISNDGNSLILICNNRNDFFDFYYYQKNGDFKYIGSGKTAFFIN